MQPVNRRATRYDTTTIIFHWITAILVAAQWLGAQTIDWFPRGAPRIDARSVHIVCGLSLAVILLARIVWRLTSGRRLPPAGPPALSLVARTIHIALYALIAAMVLVGIALTWTRGDTIFNLSAVPPFDPGNRALADQVQDVHATIGWIIIALAALHASAALFHRYVRHDNVLHRMIPTSRP